MRAALVTVIVIAVCTTDVVHLHSYVHASRVNRANLNSPNEYTTVLLKEAKMPNAKYHPPELIEWFEDCDFLDTMTMNKPSLPKSMLEKPYQKLGKDDIERFQRNGFIALRGVISKRELRHRVRVHDTKETLKLSKAIQVCAEAIFDSRAIWGERESDFESFFRIHNLWRNSRFIRQLVFSPRFAKIAADLMGVEAVRLYQDSLFTKEAGHNSSRWHQDHVASPFASGDMKMVTMWLPLQHSTDDEMGALRFAAESHSTSRIYVPESSGDGNTLGTLSDEQVRSHFTVQKAAQNFPKGRLRFGDATFHDGFCLHSAGPNLSTKTRWALAVQYVAADITAMTPAAFDSQRLGPIRNIDGDVVTPDFVDVDDEVGHRVGDDFSSFGEWLRAADVFGEKSRGYIVTPVEHPLLPIVWSSALDTKLQYYKSQGEYDDFQAGVWKSSDASSRICPLNQQHWTNIYGDGCQVYKSGGKAHDYCISDGQEAYIHCASSCSTMCTSSSFHKEVLERNEI